MLQDESVSERYGIVASIVTSRSVEYLAYSVFEAIMTQMEPMFAVQADAPRPRG